MPNDQSGTKNPRKGLLANLQRMIRLFQHKMAHMRAGLLRHQFHQLEGSGLRVQDLGFRV